MNAPPIGTTQLTRAAVARGVDVPAATSSARGPRRLGLIGSAVAVLFLMIGVLSALAPSASAAAGAQINQCNGVYNTGGRAVECHVIITNRVNLATGTSSATGTIESCHGAAGAAPLCTTTPITQLSTVVRQCNGSASGAGGTLRCSVLVTNTITGGGTTSPATVNQCIGSGTGGGAQPTTACSPKSSTTNADITQCNGSATGGGGTRRVKCTVSPSTSSAAVPITIDQCNGSANGGGSLVTCTSQIINNFVTAPPTSTPTSTTAPTTTATTGPTDTSTTGPTDTSSPTDTSGPSGPTDTSTRPRPSGTVRPTVATRPTTAASVTTTGKATSSSTSGRTTAATTGNNTVSTVNHATSTTSTNGVATASTTTSSSTTTSLASTGVPAARQALLALLLLSAGVALMLVGRRPRWIGKHR